MMLPVLYEVQGNVTGAPECPELAYDQRLG